MKLLPIALRIAAPSWPPELRAFLISLIPDVIALVREVKDHAEGELVEELVPALEALLERAVAIAPASLNLSPERIAIIAAGLGELALWIDELVERKQGRRR